MNRVHQTVGDDFRHRPSYEVRVRGTRFLWGSAGIVKDIAFSHPLVLHIRNDTFGEPITLGKRVAGASTTLGVIEPGECVSLPLETLSGVFAICALETTVSCFLH